jgi:hypothetical protein
MHEVHSGLRSIYCARNGFNSHYKDSTGNQPWNVNLTSLPESASQSSYVLRYDTNQDSIMRKEVLGARYYNTVTMSFWFYSDTGVSDAKQSDSGETVGYDFLNAIYYTGSGEDMEKHVLWTDSQAQATAKTWTQVTLDVPNIATWIGFEFVSGTIAPEGGDASDAFSAQGITVLNGGMKEGVFLDDITVVGTDPAPDVPLVTSVSSLPHYEANRSFPVEIEDNAPQVALEYAYLYYRMAGESNWTKYTTADNLGGSFSVFPINFVADQDGTYEFFSVGVNRNDVVEEMRNSADGSTIVDSSDPMSVITVVGEELNGAYNGAASFTITSTDIASGIDHISYRIDGGPWIAYDGSVGLATNGTHAIEYYATDLAGNSEEIKNSEISIVNGANGVLFPDERTDYPVGDVTINFTVASSSAITKLEYSLDGGSFVDLDIGASSLMLTDPSKGAHSVTIRAIDSTGSVIQGELEFTVGGSGAEVGGLVGDIIGQPLMLIGLAGMAAVVIGAVWYVKRKKD